MNNLFVRTTVIKDVDNFIQNINNPSITTRCHIIGARGLGKSTILNYFAYKLYSNIKAYKVIPIHATMLGKSIDEKDLEHIFFRSLLESLFYIPDDFIRFNIMGDNFKVSEKLTLSKEEYKLSLQNLGIISFEYIYTAFENQIANLKEEYNKIIFLIDGLDKQDTKIVLKFLRNTQERFNNLINKYNCIFIYAADPSWRDTLGSPEFSGVRGMNINLRGWTVEEVKTLIQRRLESAGIYLMPFDMKAIEILVEDYQGNCRQILQYSTALLHYSANQQITTIGAGLARQFVWDESAKDKFLEKIITDTDYRYAFEKIKNIYRKRQTMNILIAIYSNKNKNISEELNYAERSSIGITMTDYDYMTNLELLIKNGCIRRSRIPKFLELENDIQSLFEYADELGQSVVSLPVILTNLESDIADVPFVPKQTIIISTEIQNIFEKNSSQWFGYEMIYDQLISNPRTRERLKTHFKKNFELNVKKTIPLIVSSFYRDGKLMIDDELKEYRWRSKKIDYKNAEFFRSKEIIDRLENAEIAIEVNLDRFYEEVKNIIYELYRKLMSYLGKKIILVEEKKIISDLKMLNINIKTPMPLEFVLRSFDNPSEDIEEVKILFLNVILYAKRIKSKINKMKRLEKKNIEILKKLDIIKVGTHKKSERGYFNSKLIKYVLSDYGKMIDLMTKQKINKEYISQINEFNAKLLEEGILLKGLLLECNVCGLKVPIVANEINLINCPNDNSPMKDSGNNIYVISNDVSESWVVWMEEYTKNMLQKLPIRHIETGITVQPHTNTIKNINEVDLILIYNGLFIAIECIEYLSTSKEKDDIQSIINKLDYLDVFDVAILVYKRIDNNLVFQSKIKKYEKKLFPVQIVNPKKYPKKLSEILNKIEEKINYH
ncbi:MAG: hypothetical protein ACTSWX_01220 [Promethearchaeota archaeon]